MGYFMIPKSVLFSSDYGRGYKGGNKLISALLLHWSGFIGHSQKKTGNVEKNNGPNCISP